MENCTKKNIENDFGGRKPNWVYQLPEKTFNFLIQKYCYFSEPNIKGIAQCRLDNGHSAFVNVSNGEEFED